MTEHENKSIKCTVENCEHHCTTQDYCSLDCICVGTHESDPTVIPCTDCQSYKCKG